VSAGYDTLPGWLKQYLSGGLSQLLNLITHQKPSRPTVGQQQQLKVIALTQHPTDVIVQGV
jgi:hypothetical protein